MLSRRPLAGAAKQSSFAQRPPVPLLQPTQPQRPIHFLAPVLCLPVIERRNADPDPLADFLRRNSGLCLLQHSDNLLFTKPALIHLAPLVVLYPEKLHLAWTRFRWAGHEHQ